MGPLSPYRVIDLTDDRGNLAGLIFAQLGAEVVAVEPPHGHRTRRMAPFADDRPGTDRSLVHRAYNRGKKSLVLADDELLELIDTADVVLDCGVFDLDLGECRERNPRLITVAITAFGETGPKADWPASDLTIAAASGTMSLTGDDDRAPLRISTPMVWNFAALDAACAAMIALTERHRSGRGQHTSVSAQASYISTNQFMMTYPLAGATPGGRVAGGTRVGPLLLKVVNECLDGYAAAAFLFGPVFGPYTIRLWQWVHEEGGCPDSYLEVDWIGLGLAITDDPEAIELFAEATETLSAFLRTKTKAQVAEAAHKHRLLALPVATTGELLESGHLSERGYWEDVGGARSNGRFAVFRSTPLDPLGPAPALGQHMLGDLDPPPAQRSTEGSTEGSTTRRALSGLRVLDFTWALAGPEATRQLADHGATVIRIESELKPDPMRGAGPFLGEPGGFENSISWHSANAGKLSFTLDIGSQAVRPVLEDLIRWADVIVESFSPGVLDRHGLGAERLLELNPDAIVLSSTLAGQTGPLRELSGFGTSGAAVAGLYPTTGWPDRDPAGPWGPYTDYPAHRFGVIAILAAFDHRHRGGRGQQIDYSQAEGAMHLIAPFFLDTEINGRDGTWNGNADLNMAPHGVYPVRGEDRWIAIACETDAQWSALARLMGSENASADLPERLAHAAELDAQVSAWTADQDVEFLEALLIDAGIAAHRVAFADDVQADPQLRHRDYFAQVEHPIHGETWAERKGFDLHRTPAQVRQAGPTLGGDVWEVLTEHLGYDDDAASEWIATGDLR